MFEKNSTKTLKKKKYKKKKKKKKKKFIHKLKLIYA